MSLFGLHASRAPTRWITRVATTGARGPFRNAADEHEPERRTRALEDDSGASRCGARSRVREEARDAALQRLRPHGLGQVRVHARLDAALAITFHRIGRERHDRHVVT